MNDGMNARLKELRKRMNKTQNEFCKLLGISQGALSDIERYRIPLSDKNIKLICMQLNVNEEWLVSGSGDIFSNKYEQRADLSDLEKSILTKFNLLDEKERLSIIDVIDCLYNSRVKLEYAKGILGEFPSNNEDVELDKEHDFEAEIQKELELFEQELRDKKKVALASQKIISNGRTRISEDEVV